MSDFSPGPWAFPLLLDVSEIVIVLPGSDDEKGSQTVE